MSLNAVVLETGPEPAGTVIWLHGLGADGHDFEAIVPELKLPPGLALRFIFPHAPVRPVTVNGGMRMRAWYDIKSLDALGRADETGIAASAGLLDELVEAEITRGIDTRRILLAGFSQGGAIVLQYALGSGRAFAGLMALSTYLALPQQLAAVLELGQGQPDRSLPIFMAHGTLDNMVPHDAGLRSAGFIRELGFTVDWHEYAMGHGVCPAEITDIRDWLLRCYAPAAPAS